MAALPPQPPGNLPPEPPGVAPPGGPPAYGPPPGSVLPRECVRRRSQQPYAPQPMPQPVVGQGAQADVLADDRADHHHRQGDPGDPPCGVAFGRNRRLHPRRRSRRAAQHPGIRPTTRTSSATSFVNAGRRRLLRRSRIVPLFIGIVDLILGIIVGRPSQRRALDHHRARRPQHPRRVDDFGRANIDGTGDTHHRWCTSRCRCIVLYAMLVDPATRRNFAGKAR